jgi:hypothetical protein
VTATLPSDLPAKFLEGSDGLTSNSIREGQASERDFDLSSFNREWQTAFSPDFQAQFDGFFDILQSFGFGFPLADAAGNGGAFDHPHSVFVAVNGDGEFHWIIYSLLLAVHQASRRGGSP